jgi:putative methionine-R-sulfoxide reductase with GAF domain
MMLSNARRYDLVAAQMQARGSRLQRMQVIVDSLWEALHGSGVTWVGFYIDRPEEPDDLRLELGPHRNRPACSPIGLHGVCGQALQSRRVRLVSDVSELGDAYIACDPRDRSEIAVPLVEAGIAWAVLDLDSHQVGAFSDADEAGLHQVLRAAGFAT